MLNILVVYRTTNNIQQFISNGLLSAFVILQIQLSHKTVTAEMQAYLKENQKEEQKKEEHVVPLNDNFIVEPDMSTVLKLLIPKLAHLMLYTALLDSIASEHAARMVAMQTATDNADELLRELNLQYNKSRQQAITNELLDIVGGSVNN
jgi:F-type H+-transporting ATPase subunit gamma